MVKDHISRCDHRTQMTVRGEHNDNADVNRDDSVTSLDTLMILTGGDRKHRARLRLSIVACMLILILI